MSYKQQAPLPVNEGGTGDLTLTSHGVIVAENTSASVSYTHLDVYKRQLLQTLRTI